MAETVNEGKKPCIWMEAGVVDFKICHHCFDCASCEFDRAMTAAAAQSLSLRGACEMASGQPSPIFAFKEKLRQRSYEQLLEDQSECYAYPDRPEVEDVYGFAVPDALYLHQGHTWAALETCGRVRLGLDDFSQKLLGPADKVELPDPGAALQRNRGAFNLFRKGKRARVLAPLDGVVEVVNPKVRQRPDLIHKDPYGEGWVMVINPTNLKPDLEKMLFGRRNISWIENESHRLLGMLESSLGTTLPSGGMILDDIYGQHPRLGWKRLVREFLRTV